MGFYQTGRSSEQNGVTTVPTMSYNELHRFTRVEETVPDAVSRCGLVLESLEKQVILAFRESGATQDRSV
jgi:hypothetical protein